MIGNLSNLGIAQSIGRVFGGAAASTREWASRSIQREQEGQRTTLETSFTDAFIDQFETYIKSQLESITESLARSGVSLKVEFYPTNLPQPSEELTGADIAIRMTIQTPTFTSEK